MYECIQLKQFRVDDRVLEAEGPLDEDSDGSDMNLRELIPDLTGPDKDGVASSTGADGGSPMNTEQ